MRAHRPVPFVALALAGFLASVDTACNAVRRARSACPILRAIADTAASFESEIADVRRKIDAGGEVVDDASPELAVRSLATIGGSDALRSGRLDAHARGRPVLNLPARASRHLVA